MFSWVPEILTTEAKAHSIYSNKCCQVLCNCLRDSCHPPEPHMWMTFPCYQLAQRKHCLLCPRWLFSSPDFLKWKANLLCAFAFIFLGPLTIFFNLLMHAWVRTYTRVLVCVCASTHVEVRAQFVGVAFPFPCVGPRDQTQVMGICGLHLWLLSCLSSQSGNVFKKICIISSDFFFLFYFYCLVFMSEVCVSWAVSSPRARASPCFYWYQELLLVSGFSLWGNFRGNL